jgi:phage replication-related protein YjqB (UPF0714/DUF867 family)
VKDKYRNFRELRRHAQLDKDFQSRVKKRAGTVAIIAPHGGGIEPGTSEIAEAIAGTEFSFYAFEGIRKTHNGELHIASTSFDEPACAALIKSAPNAIAIHGEDSADEVVFLGGLDDVMLKRLRESLLSKDFIVKRHPNANLHGRAPANVCNRNACGRGVQLELSKGLRRTFFKSLSRRGRNLHTERFEQFVTAVRDVL